MINLNELISKDRIEIDEDVLFSDEYLNGPIKGFENIHVSGYITLNESEEYVPYLNVVGRIYLLDTNTLDKIPMDLDFIIEDEIDKSLINSENMLDLVELLWQNIVLEVPIRYTKNDAFKSSGDNWEVNGEEKDEIDPRMAKLLDYNKGGE